MFRRTYLAAASTAAGVALAGCSGGATGTLDTHVSDQPGDIGDFETLVLRVTTVSPKPADGERRTVDVDDTEVDLVELQGEESASVGTADLETGEYEFLQLEIGEVVAATLSDGSEAQVSTPGEAPLKFEQSFEVRSGETTTFVADFTPVKRGRSGGYVLQPVADEVEVVHGGGTETPTPS